MITYEKFHSQLFRIFSQDKELNSTPLEKILDAIPAVNQLGDIPVGSTVLIRTDLDVQIKDGVIKDHSRIEASLPTIEYCIERGWKVVIFGHIHSGVAYLDQPLGGDYYGRSIALRSGGYKGRSAYAERKNFEEYELTTPMLILSPDRKHITIVRDINEGIKILRALNGED